MAWWTRVDTAVAFVTKHDAIPYFGSRLTIVPLKMQRTTINSKASRTLRSHVSPCFWVAKSVVGPAVPSSAWSFLSPLTWTPRPLSNREEAETLRGRREDLGLQPIACTQSPGHVIHDHLLREDEDAVVSRHRFRRRGSNRRTRLYPSYVTSEVVRCTNCRC